jgi:anti-sigma regulatory factor (Ser/Thr protein kinase)
MADPIPLEPRIAVQEEARSLLAEFSLSSEAGNELEAMRWVAGIVAGLNLSESQLERLKTAVTETTMNAIEHGNRYQEDFPVNIKILLSDTRLAVRIADFGTDQVTPEYEEPDIDAKLEGKQSPRGWGLFLIKNMVDEINITTDKTLHTVELILNLKGGS